MAAAVLTEKSAAGLLVVRRVRLRDRLCARLCSWRLDTALARGTSPDAAPALSLRAARLIGPRMRRALAAELLSVTRSLDVVHHPFDQRTRPCGSEILRHKVRLYELTDRLLRAGPIDCCEVARVRLLLRDGNGPLYNEAASETLDDVLGAMLRAGHQSAQHGLGLSGDPGALDPR